MQKFLAKITINNLEDLDLVNKSFSDSVCDWIYRGQKDSKWKLETLIERYCAPEQRNNVEQNIINSYKERAPYHINNHSEVPGDDQTAKWLAHIQHHDGYTRLLDFSENFNVGLYFAIKEPCPISEDDKPSALWCVNKTKLEENLTSNGVNRNNIENHISKIIFPESSELIQTDENIISDDIKNGIYFYEPDKKFSRIYNQRGIFLFPLNIKEHSFEENFSWQFSQGPTSFENCSNKTIFEAKDINAELIKDFKIIKLIISKDIKRDCFLRLDNYILNEENLYGGIDGFARYLSYKQHWYENRINVTVSQAQSIGISVNIVQPTISTQPTEIKLEGTSRSSGSLKLTNPIENQMISDLQKKESEIDFEKDPFIKIQRLTSVGVSYHNNLKDYQKAKELHLKAYEIIKNELKIYISFTELKTNLLNIFNSHLRLEDYDRGLNFIQEFEEDFDHYIKKDNHLKYKIFVYKSQLLKDKGNKGEIPTEEKIKTLKQARIEINKAIKIAKQNNYLMDLASGLNLKGVIYKLIGKKYLELNDEARKTENFKMALEFYKKSADEAKKTIKFANKTSNYKSFYFINLKNQAIVYVDLSKNKTDPNRKCYLDEAEKLYKELEDNLPKFFGEKSDHAADFYKNYADFLLQKGDLKDAKSSAKKACEIFEKDKNSIGFVETENLLTEIDLRIKSIE